jgi:hypothetical protein
MYVAEILLSLLRKTGDNDNAVNQRQTKTFVEGNTKEAEIGRG